MKNILITGAGGFIGSYLTELCVREGFNVKAFVRYNSNSRCGWLEDSKYKEDLELVFGDIRDFDAVHQAMKGCDTVFHLAALIGIPYSYRSPLAYVRTNIEGTYNVLQSAREWEVKNILVTSTSETYGTAEYVPIDERHPKKGQSPYAASKIGADELAVSYNRSFDLPVKIVRPFNTYGPRQSARAIIPSIITQVLNGRKSLHLGSLKPTRDFTFVEDTVDGFLEIARCKQAIGETINIGMNQEISIGGVVDTIADLIGKKVHVVKDSKRVRPKKSEVERLWCDQTKLFQLTSWKPRHDFNGGLLKTIGWIKDHLDLYRAGIYHV